MFGFIIPPVVIIVQTKGFISEGPEYKLKTEIFHSFTPGITQKIRFLFFVLDDHLKSGKNHNFSIQNIFIRKFKFFCYKIEQKGLRRIYLNPSQFLGYS